MTTQVEIVQVDYRNSTHAAHLLALLSDYALDPMGGGRPLPAEVKTQLLPGLAGLPYAVSFLAYLHGAPVGLLNGFEGFSTFQAKPLLNVHDLVVDRNHRGQGFGKQLLSHAEHYSRQRGYCKLTLEVLADNSVAKGLYRKMGFSGYQLQAETGQAEFWQKPLS